MKDLTLKQLFDTAAAARNAGDADTARTYELEAVRRKQANPAAYREENARVWRERKAEGAFTGDLPTGYVMPWYADRVGRI